MTRLRRFTPTGLDKAEQRISNLARGLAGDVHDILYDDEITEVFGVEIKPPNFHTRFELAQYLVKLVDPIRTDLDNIETDSQLWSWIAVHWLNESVLQQTDVTVDIRNVARWILDADSWRTFRNHLVAGPFAIMDQHRTTPNITRIMLSGPPLAPGEAYERASSSQQFVRSPGVLQVMTELYVANDQRIKRGASRQGDVPGTIPRLITFLNQLELTHDIRTISTQALFDMLPAEFDSFRHA